ncbi:MAG: glycosyl hydrolase [Bacteroidota bacterium]
MLIIGQDLGAVGGLDAYPDGYVDNNNQIPAGVTTYTDIPNLGGLASRVNYGAGDINAQAYLDDETFNNSAIIIGLYMVGNTAGIIGGFRNNVIRELGQWIKAADRPVFLRIGYEFDGPWNNYAPADYIAAYQQIVHIMDEEEVTNVAYVWQSAGINTANISRWYPGDEYVNWVAYSFFDGGNPGQSIRDFAAQHNKPIMIAEATPRMDLKTVNADAAIRGWFAPLFTQIDGNERIKALAYINVNWDSQTMWQGQGWGDSRVEVNEGVQEYWLNRTQQAEWLKASPTLFEELQYTLWRDSLIVNQVTGIEDIEETTQPYQLKWERGEVTLHTHQGTLDQLEIFTPQGKRIYYTDEPRDWYPLPRRILNQPIIIRALRANEVYVHKHLLSISYE